MKKIAIIIISIGFALTIFSSATYWEQNAVDIGNLDAGRDTLRTIKMSPLIGIVVMGIGGILLWRDFRKVKNPADQ